MQKGIIRVWAQKTWSFYVSYFIGGRGKYLRKQYNTTDHATIEGRGSCACNRFLLKIFHVSNKITAQCQSKFTFVVRRVA